MATRERRSLLATSRSGSVPHALAACSTRTVRCSSTSSPSCATAPSSLLPPSLRPMALSPTVVWRITPELVLALDEHLGTPVDSYVNGTQTWLTESESHGVTLEWRLHPVAEY